MFFHLMHQRSFTYWAIVFIVRVYFSHSSRSVSNNVQRSFTYWAIDSIVRVYFSHSSRSIFNNVQTSFTYWAIYSIVRVYFSHSSGNVPSNVQMPFTYWAINSIVGFISHILEEVSPTMSKVSQYWSWERNAMICTKNICYLPNIHLSGKLLFTYPNLTHFLNIQLVWKHDCLL